MEKSFNLTISHLQIIPIIELTFLQFQIVSMIE